MPRFYISQAQIRQIRRLLADGLTVRKVAKWMGMSRSTVKRVQDCGDEAAWSTGDTPGHVGKLTRCTCGAMVYTSIPCLACRLRRMR